MSKKRGLTMMSVVVYIMLLVAFTGIALVISNNLSDTVFADKGIAQDMTHYEKIMYYLNKSALESSSVTVNSTKSITFSNGDIFLYDADKKELKMNDGVLCKNISSFSIGDVENNLVDIDVTLKRYTHNMERKIIIYVGE